MESQPVATPFTGVKKIAILRANALGDYLFVLPALEALRATYPEAEIVLLGQPWHAQYLRGRPGPVNRVAVVPVSKGVYAPVGGREDPRAQAAFFAAMAQERFDLALQLHGGGRYSNPFTLRLGAALTAGFKTPDAAALDRWVAYHYWQREVLRYLEAVALVGARPVTLEPRLQATPGDEGESNAVLPATTQPLALLHPGAGDSRRRWPTAKFARVGDALAMRGAHVLINGSGDERALGHAVHAEMSRPATVLPSDLSLGAFTGLLSRCRVVVSNDSGPLHLARALGAATVGIYWCGNVVQAGPMSSHRHHVHLGWCLDCPQCGRNTVRDACDHRASFVADVPTDEVIKSALALLQAEHEDRRTGTGDRWAHEVG